MLNGIIAGYDPAYKTHASLRAKGKPISRSAKNSSPIKILRFVAGMSLNFFAARRASNDRSAVYKKDSGTTKESRPNQKYFRQFKCMGGTLYENLPNSPD